MSLNKGYNIIKIDTSIKFDNNTYIIKDGSGNISFTDSISGTQTLADILAGSGPSTLIENTATTSYAGFLTSGADGFLTIRSENTTLTDSALILEEGGGNSIYEFYVNGEIKTRDKGLLYYPTNNTSIAIGYGTTAPGFIPGADYNIAIGYDSFASAILTTTADNNIGIGYQTLKGLTSGIMNVAIGSQNGLAITSAQNNTLIGALCGTAITSTGSFNIGIGYKAIQLGTGGDNNIALGNEILTTSTGIFNIAFGYQTGTNVSGQYNIFAGYQVANINIVGGDNNIGIGGYSLRNLSNGDYNVGIGYLTLSKIEGGNNNIAIGYLAGSDFTSTTSSAIAIGDHAAKGGGGSVGIGYYANQKDIGSSNISIGYNARSQGTTGNYNIAIGIDAGRYTAGTSNICIGDETGINSNFSGSTNIIIGSSAGNGATSMAKSILIGYQAGFRITTSQSIIAIGYQVANVGTTLGSNPVLIGYQAGKNATGNYPIYIGYLAGTTANTGSDQIFIGHSAGSTSAGANNIGIGYNALQQADGSDNVAIGVNTLASQSGTTLTKNVAVGSNAGTSTTTGTDNTYIGYYSGYTSSTHTNRVCIGSNAGRYNTDSFRLIIDTIQRANSAQELTNALITGFFDAAPANQWVRHNGESYLMYDTGIGLDTPDRRLHIYESSVTTTTVGAVIEQASTGDAKLEFELTAVKNWAIGIDNSSTNDDFVIAMSSDLATTPVMTIDGVSKAIKNLSTSGRTKSHSTKTSGTYAVLSTDEIILLDGTTNTVTITLPTISSTNDGQIYTFKCLNSTNTVTINTDGTDTLDEVAAITETLVTNDKRVYLADNNSSKWIKLN